MQAGLFWALLRRRSNYGLFIPGTESSCHAAMSKDPSTFILADVECARSLSKGGYGSIGPGQSKGEPAESERRF